MKTVLGKIRRCDEEYHLFAPGDRVAIGVSGGKDSMLLLKALSLYRYVRHGDFSLQAITLTSGKEKPDTSALEAYAPRCGVPFCASGRSSWAATSWRWPTTGRTCWRPS